MLMTRVSGRVAGIHGRIVTHDIRRELLVAEAEKQGQGPSGFRKRFRVRGFRA